MPAEKTVLISGIGIAGMTIGKLLSKDGYKVTLIERSETFRMGGQPVDIRGAALQVCKQMGILDSVYASATKMKGMSIVDTEGKELERNTEWTLGNGELHTEDVELLRDDLVRILRESNQGGVEEIFGETIEAMKEEADGVYVQFKKTPPRKFDLVIGADGLHSRVRRLIFGPADQYIKHLNQYLSVFTTDNFLNLQDWQNWYRTEDQNYLVFPVRNNTKMRVGLWFNSPQVEGMREMETQLKLTAERMQGQGPLVDRFLEAMTKADDFYCSPIAQIKIDHYYKGRVALIGDAGYCASPFAGQGTSMALIAAYILAAELRKANGNYSAAFAQYETRLKPFVAITQNIVNLDRGAPNYIEEFDKAKNAIAL